MKRRVKLGNNNYLDSSSIIHNKSILSEEIKSYIKVETIDGTLNTGQEERTPITPFFGILLVMCTRSYMELHRIYAITGYSRHACGTNLLEEVIFLQDNTCSGKIEFVSGSGDDSTLYLSISNTGSKEFSYIIKKIPFINF